MIITVFVTIPEKNVKNLVKTLLTKKVCACVNIIKNVKSFFWWKGKIDEAQECLLIIKTKKELFPKLKNLIKKNHPYDVPEIIAFKVDNVNKEYLSWLNKEASAA